MARDSRGLLAEGLLIVVSILVAFSIDAWWQERQDRVEEKRILNALRDEFLVNAEKIPYYMKGHQLSADFSAEMIQALHEAGPGGEIAVNVRRPVLDRSATRCAGHGAAIRRAPLHPQP